MADKDGVFQNPVSVPKDWCPENKKSQGTDLTQ